MQPIRGSRQGRLSVGFSTRPATGACGYPDLSFPRSLSSAGCVLDRIEEDLPTSRIHSSRFSRRGDGIWAGCLHAGVLWALERLAWSPDYFFPRGANPARLSEIDPGSAFESTREACGGCFCHGFAVCGSDDNGLPFRRMLERWPAPVGGRSSMSARRAMTR